MISPPARLSSFTVTPQAIEIRGQNDRALATLRLHFSVGTRLFRVTSLVATASGFIGKTDDKAVTLEILSSGADSLSLELKGPFTESDAIVYFANSSVDCIYGRAFVPDADCRRFLTRDTEDFYLTNSGKIIQDKFKRQDLWMIAPPPHVFSLGDDDLGWFGLSLPEPLPVEFTHLRCHNRALSLSFHGYSPRHAGGRLPRVYLDADLADSKAILDCHRIHAEELGLINPAKKTYPWWYNPIYCTWGDQCYWQKVEPQKLDDPVSTPFGEEEILRWADGIRKIYPGEVNYIVDAGWFDYLGDYRPAVQFRDQAHFQSVLKKLKAGGFRVILWYTPFWVRPGSQVEKNHPEFLVRRRDGSIYRDQDKRAFLDFSNPAVRDYTKGLIHYFLQTLDADGFKIDMNYVQPLMSDITLFDSAWGHGNQLWLQVAKFIHNTATAIKEDAFFTLSGIESYLQPYACSIRLNDLFDFYHAKAWYDRAEMVARLMPNVPLDVDGWPASLEKMREYQFVSPVFGPPVTYYIEAVDILTVKLTEADWNRLASIWHVYAKVPCEHGMKLTIDAERGVFERRNAQGRLQAVAVDKSVLVTFDSEKIYLTANSDRAVSLPVSSPEKYTRAEKVHRNGKRESVPLFKDGQNLIMNLSDAGHGILCYEIS